MTDKFFTEAGEFFKYLGGMFKDISNFATPYLPMITGLVPAPVSAMISGVLSIVSIVGEFCSSLGKMFSKNSDMALDTLSDNPAVATDLFNGAAQVVTDGMNAFNACQEVVHGIEKSHQTEFVI